jgi:hypothetical protein
MKPLALKALLIAVSTSLGCLPVIAQDSSPTSAAPASPAPTTTVQAIHVEPYIPNANAVLFVSPLPAGKSVALFKTPDGTALAAVPIPEVKLAVEAGYKSVTFGDLVEVLDNYAKAVQDQQKRLNDLSSDYNALVQRFNRLAAINTTTPAQSYTPSQEDEKRAMRLMLFQSLLSRTAPAPPPTRIRVTDCTAYPALCVH